MDKNIGRFISRALIFTVVFVCVDQIIGMGMLELVHASVHRDGPKTRTFNLEFLTDKVNTDIVIVGASDAVGNYDAKMIEDSLCLSTYNCGEAGYFFVYQNMAIKMMLDNYVPKVLIWEIMEDGFTERDGEWQFINSIYRYYNNPYCKEVIDSHDKHGWLRSLCKTYGYNTQVFEIVSSFMRAADLEQGFRGLPDSGRDYPTRAILPYDDEVDTVRVNSFISTVKKCKEKGTFLVLASAPQFTDQKIYNSRKYSLIKRIAKDYDVPLIDNWDRAIFAEDSTLYKANDYLHLNIRGARLYTEQFIPQLKAVLPDSIKLHKFY